MPTYVMMNICARFHRNLSSNYGDTVSRKIDVNGQRTAGQSEDNRPTHIMLSDYYCWRGYKSKQNRKLGSVRNLNKMLSYRRETALQGTLQFSPKVEDCMELGDNILRTL